MKACRAHLHALQCAGLSMRKGFEDVLGGDTEGAQAMQDGLVKASHLCKLWIYVQRIGIPAQPVQRCLVFTSFLLYHRIWLSAAWEDASEWHFEMTAGMQCRVYLQLASYVDSAPARFESPACWLP